MKSEYPSTSIVIDKKSTSSLNISRSSASPASEKRSCRFSLCCCISRRTGTLIVGIIDVLLGILCILATVALLAQNLTEQKALSDTEMGEEKINSMQELIAAFVLILIACGVPSLVTLFTGIVAIYASNVENPCLTAYTVALNFLLVLGLIGMDIFLFFLGLRMSLLYIYISATILQIYLGLNIFDFYKKQRRIQNRLSTGIIAEESTKNDETKKLAEDT